MELENYFTANADLLYTFNHVIPWDRIVPAIEGDFADPDGPRDGSEAVDLYRDALTLIGEYSGTEIAGRAREVDDAGAQHRDRSIGVPEPLQRNLDGLKELGVTGLSVPRSYGGEGFPFTVSSMALEMISRACASTMVQYAFYLSPAMMLLRFASDDLKREYVPRLARGEISGSIAMTEPQAGSDVGRVATVARESDGEWRITGRKQFITNGSGDICVVLARSEPDSTGLDGLSLFLVERLRTADGGTIDNYRVERAENKICITASVTCGLAFEDSHGVLLGKRGNGWREILTFMNESRVAVGIQGLGVGQAALAEAQRYASERVQMGKPIREHPLIAGMVLDMEATISALRALAYEATTAYDISEGLKRQAETLPERDPRRADLLHQSRVTARYLRELTPLVKWFGAEEVIGVTRKAMQIYGGYGVIKDYDVERLLRDSLILPIYEGTSQIQALMATKDIFKAAVSKPTVLVGGTVSPTLAAANFPGMLGRLYRAARSGVNAAIRYLLLDLIKRRGVEGALGMIRRKPAIDDDDIDYILLHAERLTAMLAHLHAARLLAEQARADPARHPVAERSMRRALQVARDGAFVIKSGDRSALDAVISWTTVS